MSGHSPSLEGMAERVRTNQQTKTVRMDGGQE